MPNPIKTNENHIYPCPKSKRVQNPTVSKRPLESKIQKLHYLYPKNLDSRHRFCNKRYKTNEKWTYPCPKSNRVQNPTVSKNIQPFPKISNHVQNPTVSKIQPCPKSTKNDKKFNISIQYTVPQK